MTATDPTAPAQPATPGQALPPILAEFWEALGKQQAYYEQPDVPFPDPIFRIRTRPDMIFDDYFWDVFHRFPFHICHIAYYGPERSEEMCRSDGVFELRWVESSQRPTTYSLPAEPPESVTELWDAHGDKWDRGEGTDRWWSELHGRWVTWLNLLAFFGPLSTAPPARTEAQHG